MLFLHALLCLELFLSQFGYLFLSSPSLSFLFAFSLYVSPLPLSLPLFSPSPLAAGNVSRSSHLSFLKTENNRILAISIKWIVSWEARLAGRPLTTTHANPNGLLDFFWVHLQGP